MSDFLAQEDCEGYSQKSFVFPLEFLYQNQDQAIQPPQPHFDSDADDADPDFFGRQQQQMPPFHQDTQNSHRNVNILGGSVGVRNETLNRGRNAGAANF